MSAPDTTSAIDQAVAAARAALVCAPDPLAASRRLQRWAARERAFAESPAALDVDELVGARTSGVNVSALAADRARRRGVQLTGPTR